MICDVCKQKPATVYFTKVINNKKIEINLCHECAAKNNELSFTPQLYLPNFLAGLFNHGANIEPHNTESKIDKCSNCGTNYQQFVNNGLVGCNKCYDAFTAQTDLLLRRIHGNNLHRGKVPQRAGEHLLVKKELNTLKEQLQQAIVMEKFEEAAELRDRIRELESN